MNATRNYDTFESAHIYLVKKALPYYKVAYAIRSRTLEWQKNDKSQNKSLVKLGNSAAHHGALLVDLGQYFDPLIPKLRNYPVSFTNIYGVEPSVVQKHVSCEALVAILDWSGAMDDFHGRYNKSTRPFYTQHFRHITLLLQVKTTKELNEFFLDPTKGKLHYDKMKEIYIADLNDHEAKLMKRRE